jgi:hypothetical protein
MNAIETKTELREMKAINAWVWLFRVLVVVTAGVMLVSWFMPWWTIDVEGFATDAAQIRPWGLELCEQIGGFAILLKGTEMPSWFGMFMWAYLGLCMLALLVGIIIRGKEFHFGKIKFNLSQLLIGGVGFSYIVAGVVAAAYAGMRMRATFDVPLQGRAYIDMGDPLIAFVDTRLLPGYYLIYVVGLLFLVLAIFRDKIAGEKASGA